MTLLMLKPFLNQAVSPSHTILAPKGSFSEMRLSTLLG